MNKVWEWYKKRRKDKKEEKRVKRLRNKEWELVVGLRRELKGDGYWATDKGFKVDSKMYWNNRHKENLEDFEKEMADGRYERYTKEYLSKLHGEYKEKYELADKECKEIINKINAVCKKYN